MKNDSLIFTVGATTLVTLGALALALTGDKKDEEFKIEDSIYYESGFPIRSIYQEIVWEATDMVEYQNVINAVNEKVKEDRRRALEEQRLLEEKRKQEEELKRRQEEQRKKEEHRNNVNGTKTDLGTFNVSFYTANCYKCSGISKAGVDLRKSIKYQGYGVVASDWSQIPAYSIIEIEGLGQYIVLDTGGRITTGHLDVLVKTKEEAYKLGRQYLNVKVIRWGEGK